VPGLSQQIKKPLEYVFQGPKVEVKGLLELTRPQRPYKDSGCALETQPPKTDAYNLYWKKDGKGLG